VNSQFLLLNLAAGKDESFVLATSLMNLNWFESLDKFLLLVPQNAPYELFVERLCDQSLLVNVASRTRVTGTSPGDYYGIKKDPTRKKKTRVRNDSRGKTFC